MPVRVKCRCGQELVLRYGEWVYFFLGLALLCLVANSIALLLLYLRLEEVSRSSSRASATGASSLETATLETPTLKTTGKRSTPPDEASSEKKEKSPEEGGSKAPFSTASSAGEAEKKKDEDAPASSRGKLDQRSLSVEEPISGFFPPRKSGADAGSPSRSSLVARSGREEHLPWEREPLLLRLFLLEKEKRDLLFPCAFLVDPDRRLQKRALTHALAGPLPEGPPAVKPQESAMEAGRLQTKALLKRADFLKESSEGRKLLESFGVSPEDPVTSDGLEKAREEAFKLLKEKAARSLEAPPVQALRQDLEAFAAEGVDVAILIDVSRSMEWGLEGLQREALWLFPALGWAIPGVRVGLVLYRDQVEAVMGFTPLPGGDLLQLLRDARAEGGGDVPEGVHNALRAALSLGNFAWRAKVQKHIIVVGDAPPPFGEIHGLLTLGAQAHRQGGYCVHALSIRPDEGRPYVPSFPDLAREGGGRAATVMDSKELGAQIFSSLFSKEAQPAIGLVLPSIRLLFSPEN